MIIIDFEASSLRKNSHPIEVAWGEQPDAIRSFLLNPDYMAGWTDWNPKSYEYHGISREMLRREGIDPRLAAEKMVQELAGQKVYSDEPRYDTRWKNRLLADSGYDPSQIRIRDLNLYLKHMIKAASRAETLGDYICGFSCSRQVRRHRAGEDVFWLLEFVDHIRQCLCGQSK
ncbi:MAG: hypothetical protein K9K62_01355 [Desulfobacteraceae bacterium]|nr:hypothetical protein [Desulfobacteraceae bacterium]